MSFSKDVNNWGMPEEKRNFVGRSIKTNEEIFLEKEKEKKLRAFKVIEGIEADIRNIMESIQEGEL